MPYKGETTELQPRPTARSKLIRDRCAGDGFRWGVEYSLR